jgi:hypothetical protein
MVTTQHVQHSITHNGDNDELTVQGTKIPFDLQRYYFERVLASPNKWAGDSPMIAGAMELLVTQGQWAESLRLAFQETAAPPVDLNALPPFPKTTGDARLDRKLRSAWEKSVRAIMLRHPAPSPRTLEQWANVAEDTMVGMVDKGGFFPSDARSLADVPESSRTQLATLLKGAFFKNRELSGLPEEKINAFVRTAVDAFLDNTVANALTTFKSRAEGTYGLIVKSSLQPGMVAVCAHHQPLTIGIKKTLVDSQDYYDVAVVSEPAVLKVPTAHGEGMAYDYRLRLKSDEGEIAVLDLSRGRGHKPLVTLHSLPTGRDYSEQELSTGGRIVPLMDNPYISRLPVEPEDRINQDLQDVPKVMKDVRDSMREGKSSNDPAHFNHRTARALADIVFSRRKPRIYVIGNLNERDLAGQFADTLRGMFDTRGAHASLPTRWIFCSAKCWRAATTRPSC